MAESRSRRRGLGELGAAAVLLAALAGARGAGSPAPRAVTIENMRFEPATLTVRQGERVTWSNKDLFPHTVTAEGRAFDSGPIESNASWTFVARARGTFPYGCTLHPTMKGVLVVE